MAIEPHILALDKAKIQLMRKPDSAFFTTLCFNLKHRFDDHLLTAATDGRTIWFNPKFFMSLDLEEQVFLLIHESMHVAYLHMMRRADRDANRWNCAADYVINLQLVERGFKMPKMGLLDYQYAGMGTEEVYNKLPLSQPQNGMPDLKPGDGNASELSSDIQDILVRAAVQSKMAGDKPGTIPGDIEIFLEKLLNPKLSWQRILQKYFQSYAKNDYSWKKPSRRFFPKDYLPSLYSTSLANIAVAVDTSGSVSDAEFNRFVSETASILRMMKPEKITVVQFDTAIKSVKDARSVDELRGMSFTGRGGTCIGPVQEWADTNRPQVLLIFTDGYFSEQAQKSRVDTIWLIHNNTKFTAPYGRVIHYEVT